MKGLRGNRLAYVAGALTAWAPIPLFLWWAGFINLWVMVLYLWAVAASQWIGFTYGAKWASRQVRP